MGLPFPFAQLWVLLWRTRFRGGVESPAGPTAGVSSDRPSPTRLVSLLEGHPKSQGGPAWANAPLMSLPQAYNSPLQISSSL